MSRKIHLSHTTKFGPACQGGNVGARLRGEHIAEGFGEFVKRDESLQCSRCRASSLFAFLEKRAADEWEPEEPDAWKKADDALIAARNVAA